MPRGNGTGPAGRTAGYCAGYVVSGFMNDNRPRLHLRQGFRGGSGRKNRPGRRAFARRPVNAVPNYQRLTEKEELKQLENVAADLKDELEAVQQRISELKEE